MSTPRLTIALGLFTISVLILGVDAWSGDITLRSGAFLLLALAALHQSRRAAPPPLRARIDQVAKLTISLLGGIALLRHPIPAEGGIEVPIYTAIALYLPRVDASTFVWFAAAATAIKAAGIVTSALGWHWLLAGQGLRLPFWSATFTAFLIGRFLGTFLPSTLGLDGYTLYEAGRYTNEWERCVTAKAMEKVIGIAGLFAGMVVTLPFGYSVLVDVERNLSRPGIALPMAAAILATAGGIVLAVLLLLVRPTALTGTLGVLTRIAPSGIAERLQRLVGAAAAYQGQTGLLLGVLAAKFAAHFTTAVVYFFTALAIGVTTAEFWPIVFGSTIQILATLLSPTIGGEGAREAFQALLLSSQLGGVPQAVLSAALGFLAAEAPTLFGGIFLWFRTEDWRPREVFVDNARVDFSWLTDVAPSALERLEPRQ